MEATEFSKTYFDAANPQQGFAALMVCGEADAACPVRQGCRRPHLDALPGPEDLRRQHLRSRIKYAERRDDIGRLMLSVRPLTQIQGDSDWL